MLSVLKQITNMKTTFWVNSFIYYLKRIWVVGKLVPSSLFGNYRLKKTLSVVAFIIRQIIDVLGKYVYIMCFVTLPAIFIPQFQGSELSLALHVVFFLNGVLASMGDSHIFTVTRDKITCIKYMNMNARSYIQSSLIFKYIPFFLYFLPWLMYFAVKWGGSPLDGFFIWILLFSFRMAGEMFQLILFDRTGKVISRNILYNWTVIVVGLAGAYLPAFMNWQWNFDEFFLNPFVASCIAIIGCFSGWYITLGYRHYENKLHRAVDINYLLSSMMKAGSASAFKEVEVKEEDVRLSESSRQKFGKLKGYAYINALFFARHKRQLLKPVFYRLAMAIILFAGVVIFTVLNREYAVKFSENLTVTLPYMVFLMYFMTVADKACRAMFYNCDKDMLHYAHYRQPRTLLKNFRIRLFKISLYDFIPAGAICLAAAAFCLICDTDILTLDMMLFCMAIMLLSVLFTAHHLCMYYIFQPYSESLQVKNPFFSIINTIMYMLCFFCMRLNMGGGVFTSVVFIFTIVYIAGILLLVYRRAPKSFRVK